MGRKQTRLILFLPEQESLIAARGSVLERYPDVRVLHLGELLAGLSGDERSARLEQELAACKDSGYVLLDPPLEVEELERIDAAARRALGRKGAPRAVFFAPPRPPRKDAEDGYEGYRADYRARYQHYHRDRRSVVFERPRERSLRKAVRLAGKGSSPVRWALLTPMALTMASLLALTFLLRDPLLRRAAIHLGQQAFGARVELGELDTTLQPQLRLEQVRVADRRDPLSNLFELERAVSDINFGALFGGAIHVREARIEGLRFGTERQETGALGGLGGLGPGGSTDKSGRDGAGATDLESEPRRRFEELIDALRSKLAPPEPEELETVRLARQLEEEAIARLAALRARVQEGRLRERVAEQRARIEALSSTEPPAALGAFRGRLEALQGGGGSQLLTEARSSIEAVARASFDARSTELADVQRRWTDLRDDVSRAEEVVSRASKLEKVGVFDIPRLIELIGEVQRTFETLERAPRRLEELEVGATAVLAGIEADREAALAQVEAARSTLVTAGEEASAPLADEWRELQAELEDVRAEVSLVGSGLTTSLQETTSLLAELRAEWQGLEEELADSQRFLEEGAVELEEAARRDAASLRERYSFAGWSPEELLGPLLGQELLPHLEEAWRLHERLAPFLGGLSAGKHGEVIEVELPGGGRRFIFPADREAGGLPSLWVETAILEGSLELGGRPLGLSGEVRDLSSSPALLGRAIEARIEATGPGRSLVGELTHGVDGVLSMRLLARGFEVEELHSKSPHAPTLQEPASLDWELQGRISSEGFEASLVVTLGGLRLGLPEVLPGGSQPGSRPDSRLAAPLQELYGGIEQLQATLTLQANEDGLQQLGVESDLGPALKQAFEALLQSEVEATLTRAESELEGQLSGPREAALESVRSFGVDGPALLSELGLELPGLSKQLETRGAALTELLQTEWSLPDLPDLPEAAAGEELAGLEAELDQQEARILEVTGGQSDEAGELLQAMTDLHAARDAARRRLEEELKRLEDLRP